MIRKYHDMAKTNHAIIVPQIGIESAPSDLLAFSLVQLIRKEASVGTKEVITSLHQFKATPSGGTLATVMGLMDSYSLKDIGAANNGTWISSPVLRTKPKTSSSAMQTLLGVRSVNGLGTLVNSPTAGPNIFTVQRSWGLLDGGKLYGLNFTYKEYLGVRNRIVGILLHIAFAFGALALALPPFRWLAKKFLYAPGQGATREATSKEVLEYRAVATADEERSRPRRAFGRLRWDGPVYYFTGVCLAEAAMVILKDDELVKRLDGGLLTPATLGQAFIDRMKSAGITFEVEMMSDT